MEKGTTPTRGIRNNNPLNIRKGVSKWRGMLPADGAVAGSTSSARNAQTGIGAEKADLLSPYEHSSMGAPSGYDPEFCQFIGMEYGFRAAFVLMGNYITRHGCNTIEKIVSRWAPKADGNNTDKYINDVCRLTGIGGRAPLAASDPRLKEIVWAMAQIESGQEVLGFLADLERGWEISL